MKLSVHPPVPLPVFSRDLELVIRVGENQPPEIMVEDGCPRPDRHLLLGLAQSVAMAVEEKDPELVVFHDPESVIVNSSCAAKRLPPGLVTVRARDGSIGVVAPSDTRTARRLARQALRWFTGTIRLDIP